MRFLRIICDQKISPKISIFSASEPASSLLQLQPMREEHHLGFGSAHPSSQLSEDETLKHVSFDFAFEDEEGDEQGMYFYTIL